MADQPDLDKMLDAPPRLRIDERAPSTGRAVPATYSPQGATTVSSTQTHLLDYARTLYKRRWIAITAFTTVFVSVIVYSFTATPIYQARVRLLIEPENRNVVEFKEVLDEGQGRTDYSQTQYNLLQSRALARRTLDSLKLWDHPLFGGQASGFSIRRTISRAVASASALLAGGSDAPPPVDESEGQSITIDNFLAQLTVSPVRNSRIVDVLFWSSDPQMATQLANSHARNYIEQNLEFKFVASKEATDWLGERLAEQRAKVSDSEAALQNYRERNDAIALEDRQNIVVQKLSELNTAVTRAKMDRLEKEAIYNQLRSIQNERDALDSFPAIISNSFVQQMKAELASLQRQRIQLNEKLGERHPEMVKLASAIESTDIRLQGEIAKVVESVRNQYLAARTNENNLVAALDAQKGDALGLNRKGIEYGVLQRDFESNRQIYESLLQRAKETGVAGELKTSNIRVVDTAELPRRPISPRRGMNLLLGLFGGMVFGIGLAFFFEYMDNRIKTPAELKEHLGLPFLGMIPQVNPGETAHRSLLISNGVPANYAEAFRAMRTNVLFSTTEEGARSIVVTSTGPGEGKTLVACNLAVGLAQAGLRVLLIDADLRRPKVHEAFAQSLEPGLSNLLVGSAKASDSVKKTLVQGLWVLTSGRIPPNPSELLGSRRFKDFINSLSEHFEWVIIDAPPVMAVTDVSLIAHSVSGVLFVVGAEMTNRYTAQVALDQLEAAKAKFVGAVLNRVDLERQGYYYSHYYRREYFQYYTRTPS